MSPELEEKLARAYPLLFREGNEEVQAIPTTCGFGVGDGWYDLIDSLCGLIYWPYERARQHFESTRQRESAEGSDGAKTVSAADVETARLAMKAAAEALPVLTQVKEKYGTLRFYTSGGDDAVERYVEFAEYFSSRLCEDCGAPGKLRGGGWLRTLCDKHAVRCS